MKRGAILTIMLVFIMTMQTRAGEKWHVGLMAGTPTGISLSRPFSGGALNFGAGWKLEEKGFIHVHADYVRNINVHLGDTRVLPSYYGVGAVLRFGKEGGLGARLPLGLIYRFSPHPFEVFAEVAPLFYLIPATRLDISGAIGIRYIWP